MFVCIFLVLSIGAPHALAIDAANGKHKVLFLAGKPSHGYGAHDHLAGCTLLAKSLSESGLPIETQVYHYDWPTDPKIFDGVDCVVMYGDGGQSGYNYCDAKIRFNEFTSQATDENFHDGQPQWWVVTSGPRSTSDLVRPSGLINRCQVWPATRLLPSAVPARNC